MKDGRRSQAAFAGLTLLVNHEEEGWERRLGPLAEPLVRRAVEGAAAHAGLPAATRTELGVTLADDDVVQALNAEWRGKDKPTNILSFPARALKPGEAPGPLLGDLVLALETCEREAGEEDKPFEHHFTHLIVHGFLHLLGHDHEEEAAAERMEAMEIAILADLGIDDPYRAAGEEQPRETTNLKQERR